MTNNVPDMWHERATAAEWNTAAAPKPPPPPQQLHLLRSLLGGAQIGDRALLDLGVGSGLVAEAVLERLPEATLVGIDFAHAMLELARERLRRFEPRVCLLEHDLAAVATLELPQYSYAA